MRIRIVLLAAVSGDWAEGAHAKFGRFAPGMVAPCVFFTYGDALWDVEMVEN